MPAQERFSSFRWIPVIAILLCVGCVLAGVLTKAFFGAPFIPRLGGTIDIRGTGIAILRLPTDPIQEIEVFSDGEAIRYAYPITPNVYTRIVLGPAQKRELEEFRIQWCHELPSFRTLGPDEPFYDLAFRCTGYNVKQAKVPVDMLPEIFADILKQLPAPPPS
ncbi:MAG: hypothetical protein IPP13_07435 [Kouleothrix sp.]|jgi:hypothetical protein|nr:hypothetical protein [Kouleothrix sp.]